MNAVRVYRLTLTDFLDSYIGQLLLQPGLNSGGFLSVVCQV